MYNSESLDSKIILQWSKLLEYDFFRVYSQHLILYAPPASAIKYNQEAKAKVSNVPEFRKNIYTQELIHFILELIETGKKNKNEIMKEYGIPKTTLYKWIKKYSN